MYGWESYCHFSKMPCFHPVHQCCYETRRWKEPLVRVPSRFFGVRDFPSLKLGIQDFKENSGARSRLKVCAGGGIPKITLGITGLHENSGRDDGIEEHYWGPSLVTSSALSAWKLAVHLVSFLIRSEQIIWCSSRNTWKDQLNPEPSLSFRFRVDDVVGSDSYEIINEDILGNDGMLSQQL